MPNCGLWSKPTLMATVSKNVFDGLRATDGFAMLELEEAQRVRALGAAPSCC